MKWMCYHNEIDTSYTWQTSKEKTYFEGETLSSTIVDPSSPSIPKWSFDFFYKTGIIQLLMFTTSP